MNEATTAPEQDFDSGRAWIQTAEGEWFQIDVPEQYDIAPEEFALWMQNAELAGVLDESAEEDRERLEQLRVEIPHADAASRMGYALRALRSDYRRDTAVDNAEAKRLLAKLRTKTERFEMREAYLVQQLTQWHRMQLDLDPTRTTIDLPGVTMKSTKARAKAMLAEEILVDIGTMETQSGQEAFEDFLMQNWTTEDYPAFVRYKETWDLSKNDVMKMVKSGHIVSTDEGFRMADPETGELGHVLPWLVVTQPTDLDRTFKAVTE